MGNKPSRGRASSKTPTPGVGGGETTNPVSVLKGEPETKQHQLQQAAFMASVDQHEQHSSTIDEVTLAKVECIRQSVIGSTATLKGPFGAKPLIYADYTASGRALGLVEDYIRDVVLPLYANTHTEASATGLQTTRLREEARDIIREACGGTPQDHAVLFTGSGSTAAIAELIGVLDLDIKDRRRCATQGAVPESKRPVVFIGPYEHHSNEVSWRETTATVVTIPETADGAVNLDVLKKMLKKYRKRPLKIGSFSAGSNVTGVLTDVPALATLLHKHGALACFDYAAAAPYVDIDMQLRSHPSHHAYLDAVFISPHKFVGGPGTPGVLVARRELFQNATPVHPAGGTVEFVSPTRHKYKADIETREEGGTPDIVGSIRCGLVFKLKMDIGVHNIHALEMAALSAALKVWTKNPNIVLLGNQTLPKLTITSIVIRVGKRYLHHNFVVALLNDLFGIQSRGGCSCAGPYGHRLLHVTAQESDKFSAEIAKGAEGIKPGCDDGSDD
ncbi:aminotransferase [Salpingoeca rosetta]|uniref:Aminotransferase n=1 Tax=Salpingoeca rosetta (strain ATCC 50818 / BSB-021) TaxID=946362 RepID=F2UIK0_SALR5|nr:aminotransferase [Salpingoeca rosetta]EGD77049.1 aminotransferase [Salpingoeca rosetta]|eukprot:XP_004990889.1 aminotransferase [Salpingoeca rosetta]